MIMRAPILAALMAAGLLHALPAVAQDCIVTSQATIQVGAEAKGVLATVDVDRGARVSAGQVLATLESSEEQALLEQARIEAGNDVAVRLAEAKAAAADLKVTRLRTLVSQQLGRETELEQAELEAATARLEIEQAKLALERAQSAFDAAESALARKTIRAPFDAVVIARLMHPGEFYSEQSPILTLARIDHLYVEAFLPFDRRAELSQGQPITITLEDGRQRTARVDVIDPVLDAATATFGLRLVLDNAAGDILAGSRCQLNLGQ
ncbi:efflux RND transporter periplasmic adaptor subunit [Limimaricola sp.]|uniref:efflux RND transporter periplasmic adaptor subunit n=1 Tax=Limimaricola sp. TaxID=2211665 RepID=UPI0025C1FD1C|nr:efflux RND transporter periplasmic adaptor subunit [Limimaricola sp.]